MRWQCIVRSFVEIFEANFIFGPIVPVPFAINVYIAHIGSFYCAHFTVIVKNFSPNKVLLFGVIGSRFQLTPYIVLFVFECDLPDKLVAHVAHHKPKQQIVDVGPLNSLSVFENHSFESFHVNCC